MAGETLPEGKLMRHGCGYPFQVRVITHLNDYIVIEYRDAHRLSLPYYHCPRCEERLELWWQVPAVPAPDAVLFGGETDE